MDGRNRGVNIVGVAPADCKAVEVSNLASPGRELQQRRMQQDASILMGGIEQEK